MYQSRKSLSFYPILLAAVAVGLLFYASKISKPKMPMTVEAESKKESSPPIVVANIPREVVQSQALFEQGNKLYSDESIPQIKIPEVSDTIDTEKETTTAVRLFVHRLKINMLIEHPIKGIIMEATTPDGVRRRYNKGDSLSQDFELTFEGIISGPRGRIPQFNYKGKPLAITEL